MLKPVLLALAACLPLSAVAGDTTLARGSDYDFLTRMPTGLGPGISIDHIVARKAVAQGDKPQASAIGVMFGLPVPALMRLDLGGKLAYLESDGYASAAMVGGRLTIDLPASTELFAQGFYAPSSAASGSVKSVSDSMVGLRWSPLKLVGVEAGYRVFEVKRNDSQRDRSIADGAYAGVSVAF